ncbi:M4 family metallopeptidase [Flavobacterium ginsenosidimutans]|uniref:M4 family metallopeptidase n=1 Tax=Flavobacterium ginsenosidimutans TaxID=687844 RepID=UPI000DAEE58B|nr:M4 family metallopeptidase [Flavobacterium ginsenosidimutans]KAF2326706.1 T9SS type A sorting domain-containing protein [Flavobacterium ginsenosidimutans]
MNQTYSKPRYLFVLLSFFVFSFGMAQSPLQKNKSANVQMAIQTPGKTTTKDQVSKKTSDSNAFQEADANDPLLPKQEDINGKKLSQKESEAVNQQFKASQKLFKPNASSAKSKAAAQDSISKLKSFAKSANLTSRNVFEVKKAAFGLSSSDKMQLKSVSDKNGRSLATYQQLHNSIPVEGAIYKVRENKTKIDAFGQITSKLPANSSYKVNASQGLEYALKDVNAKEYVWQSKKLSSLVNKKISQKPQGELVYVGPSFSSELKEYHLAWKYDVFATNPQSSQTIYVDANSGKTILKIDLNRDVRSASSAPVDGRAAIGNGKARFTGNVTFGTTQYAEGYKLETLEGKFKVPIYTLNMNHAEHASDEVLTEYIDEDNNWNDLYNKDHDEAAIDIHWGLQTTLNYYEEKFNRNSVDDKGMTIFGLAHLGTHVQNASWTGGWAQFGDGDTQPFVSLGITGHEMTHAVTQFSAGLIYLGESGAMNESFSDIFGISIELYAGKDSKNDIWMLGDELYKHGSLRSMADPKAAGQPDTYGGEFWADPANTSYDNGGVHQNSGITNYWYYLLVEGGQGVNDLDNSYTIKGLGLAKAEKIAYLTLTEYLSPSSNFSDMRQASLLVAEDLYGLGSEEYKQVTNAWYAIGVGAAYSDKQLSLVSVQDPSLPCGQLKGDEPFYVTLKNTGSTLIKANEVLNYKLRAMAGALGRLIEFYSNDGTVTFDKDLGVGEEITIEIKDNIPYQVGGATNYIEVKMDLNPITEFGTKDGYSFTSQIIVPIAQKDFDIKVTNLEIPDYTGDVLTANNTLAITLYNLGCQDIPAGTQLKIGYADTAPGSAAVWKDITLETAFKGKSEIKIPFDGTVDLSAVGLHTYEAYVTYDKDPVTANNSILNAAYSGTVTQFPYVQGFERTPGGWNSKALSENQKFIFQNYPASFRSVKSQYMWGMVDFKTNERMGLNSDFVLESPIFDFTNVVSPYVEFDLYYLLHRTYDGLIVEYSEDKGKSWKKVTTVNYPEIEHNNDLFDGGWFTGVNNSLRKDPYQIRLNELAGKKAAIRFRVKSDDYYDGFLGGFIDNILVKDAPYDLEVVSAKLDAGKCDINNNTTTVNTYVTNNFATSSQVVNVTTKILDAAQNEVFSLTEKRTLAFTKFKDTLTISVPNINLKTVGEHTVSVSVFPEDMLQDVKQANNSYVFTYDNWNNEDMKVSVLPYKMDFEDASKYKGWRTSENKGAAGWKYGERADLGSPAWFLEDHTHFMASNDDKCNCDSSNDMLVSPVFDLTNYKEAHLSFDGFGDPQQWSDGYVKVSTDGGQTWKEVFHMPYYGAWWEYGVDLTEYAGKSCVMIAFQHNDNGFFANGFAVDNIQIKEAKSNLRPSNLVVAETVYEDAPSHEFNINLRNSAYKTLDKFTIEYQISQNGTAVGKPVSIEKSEEILVGQTITYKIDGLPKLAPGKYDIAVKAFTDNEPKDQAQVLKGSFEVIEKAREFTVETFSTVPSGSLFGQKGFVSSLSDDNYPWRVVVNPDNEYLTVPQKDHTGDTAANMLYSQLEGLSYYSELVSPMYKLDENASAFEFYYAMQSNANDIFLVDIKTVGGTWTELWRTNKEGSFVDTEWKKVDLNITKYKGKSVMFRFRHAKSDGYSYMVLDDLKVFNEAVTDVSMQILSPKDVCGNEEYKVKLTNEGQIAIKENSIQVNLEYKNTSEKISEAVAAGIPVGGSIEYTFKTKPKLIQNGDSQVFNFTAKLENDIIAQNNTIEDYTYQGVAGDFKLFDNPSVHGYAGKSVYLNAESNLLIRELDATSYKWSTGENTSAIEVTKAGDYIVTAVLKNGCSITEKVNVTFDTFESGLASGDVCGPIVVLNPGKYKAYEWFDGSTDPTYSTTESGDYYVTVYNENGLGKTFSTSITVLENIAPEIEVVGEKKISATADAPAYQWYLNGRIIPNATQKTIVAIWEGTYSLQTTNSNGCSSMSEPIDSKGMIIGKLTNPFRVFPNPVVDTANIFLAENIEGQTQIKLYGMNGNVLWNKNYSSMPSTINISELPAGVYVLDCTVQGKKYTAKIIKK